ncbi:MAG: hypothetical protein M1826_003992 [Phylliscum demangeonii]|nr:MAG: hypothetical protein M1826_003992 [Phylliscum demangeonii]
MSDPVDRVFLHALSAVRKIPRHGGAGSSRPPAADRSKLYGLYKQSMEGDVLSVMSRPTGEGEALNAERLKWDAWNVHRGLSKTEAKRRYVALLIETMHRYAGDTPEARDLVSELELVWSQVRSSELRAGYPSTSFALPFPLAEAEAEADGDADDKASSPLQILSPSSEEDLDEAFAEANDVFSDALDGRDPHHEPNPAGPPHEATARGASPPPGHDELTKRTWRRRVQRELGRMTAEMAALRERIEHQALLDHRRRSSLSSCTTSLLRTAFRHLAVDVLIFWTADGNEFAINEN